MTKTQLVRYMAEQMEAPPKQIAAFFNLLIETATTQTRKNGEFTVPGLGKLVKAQRAAMAVLPGFKARNRGAIVNLGSVLGFDGYPYAPIYSGTKAYVQNLTRALQAELANTNVKVQLVAPASTVSEIWEVQGFPLSNLDPSTVMSTEDCVDAALLGLERNEAITAPSIEDGAAVQAYFDAGAALFGSSQNGRPASRYAPS